ncbi:MAG TPA: hypothetical protein PK514_01620 [Spirochaetota bacterium]|nr:hypothetical protein [Spirochaetota bacterium]
MQNSLHQIIAGEILNRFSSGLDLDNDTRHFLLSCEGLSGAGEIIAFLENREFDSSPVYELIFYPDTAMRFRIESLLPARGLDRSEINRIISTVETASHDILISSGDIKVTLQWCRFSNNACQYIKRLNLDVNTDIFPHKNADDFLRERILLRCGRVSYSGETAEFLGRLAERTGDRKLADNAGLFSFALQAVGNKNEKVMDQLENRKCFYESAIREAFEFSRILGKYSMEFVMAKKIPVPLTSIEEAADAIRKIDAITSLVYGIIIPPMDHGVEMLLKDGRLTDAD